MFFGIFILYLGLSGIQGQFRFLTDDLQSTGFGLFYPASSGVRRQPLVPDGYPFPCPKEAKKISVKTRPTSVHRLRPSDIEVIGALGDSLVAGSGAMEEFALGAFVEHRGVTWAAGGQGSWRKYLTLPNILKEFNPRLIGFSTGPGEFLSRRANFNVAFPVAATDDAIQQAKYLTSKMRRTLGPDKFQSSWKLVTVFFGANDLCSAQCYDPEHNTPLAHVRKLAKALDFLHKNMPRTLVNLVPVLDVTVSLRVKRRSMACRALHPLFCACLHRGEGTSEQIAERVAKMAKEFQKQEEKLVNSGRYDTRDDFTVVLQPFTLAFNAYLPESIKNTSDLIDIRILKNEKPNLTISDTNLVDNELITYDCFHFSQKGHALGAAMLWNNMLQPITQKSRLMNQTVPYDTAKVLIGSLMCPTKDRPYIFTSKNSRSYFYNGRQ